MGEIPKGGGGASQITRDLDRGANPWGNEILLHREESMPKTLLKAPVKSYITT